MGHRTPPRFATQTMATTFGTVLLIVHVVDAFDAMSSARAYRPARSAAEALQELWRCGGTQFDVEVVQALATAIPTLRMDDNRYDTAAARAARKSSLVAFTRP